MIRWEGRTWSWGSDSSGTSPWTEDDDTVSFKQSVRSDLANLAAFSCSCGLQQDIHFARGHVWRITVCGILLKTIFVDSYGELSYVQSTCTSTVVTDKKYLTIPVPFLPFVYPLLGTPLHIGPDKLSPPMELTGQDILCLVRRILRTYLLTYCVRKVYQFFFRSNFRGTAVPNFSWGSLDTGI